VRLRDILARAGLGGAPVVLVAMLAWNAGNLVFFVLAGRLIGPDEYGTLAALLAVTQIALVPAGALQVAVVRGEAVLREGEPRGSAYRSALAAARLWTPLAAVVLAGAAALGGWSASGPVGPLVLTVAVIVPMPFLFLALGELQSRHRFNAFSLAFSLIGVPRPILLLPLLIVLSGLLAGLTASALSMAAAAAVALWATRDRLRGARAPEHARRALRAAVGPLAIGLGAVALLTNLDIIVAELALPEEAAGRFAAVAVLGKAVILVPQAVSVAVLPRVAARRAAGVDTGPLLAGAVGLTLVGGAAAAGLAALLAEPVVRLTYGPDFVPSADLLAPMALVSTLLGVVVVLVNHHAGRGGDRFLLILAGVVLLQPLVFVALHGSAAQLVLADAIAYSACIVVHELVFGRGPDGIVRGLVRALRGLAGGRPPSRAAG
jgi:O-antigen/teichoic acid export membrane protein